MVCTLFENLCIDSGRVSSRSVTTVHERHDEFWDRHKPLLTNRIRKYLLAMEIEPRKKQRRETL